MKIETNAIACDGHADIARLFAQLKGSRPDFLVVNASVNCDLNAVVAEAALVGSTSLHGATSCLGVMTNAGMCGRSGNGLGYFAVWDREGAYGSALRPFSGNPEQASENAVKAALAEAGRQGETPALVWVSSTPGFEEEVIAGIEKIVGRTVPIVGGSAADNTVSGEWSIFGADTVLAEGVVVSVLFPSVEIAANFQSGYAPIGQSAEVTKAQGRRIYELDGRPAVDVYAHHSDLELPKPRGTETSILSQSSFNPLGRELAEIADVKFHLLLHPAVHHDDASISLFANVEEGDVLHFMEGSSDSLTRRAARTARQTTGVLNSEVSGALVIYCAGCMLSVLDRMDEVASGLDEALGQRPFLGVFTFGEQGQAANQENCHGNLMISCVTFSA